MDWTKDTEHIRKASLIPITLQPLVCMCIEPGKPMFNYVKRPVAIACCAACRKPYRWNVRHCTVCSKWFIKDFRRKLLDCVTHTRCFDCIVNIDTFVPMCACDKEQSIRPDFGPLGLNPRTVPKEEMDAAFDMPSVFD